MNREHAVAGPLRRLGRIFGLSLALSGCAATLPPAPPTPPVPPPVVEPPPSPVRRPPPKIALALGGGAAKGFAHIGVIKVLEAQGVRPDIVVGTSAGSVVGALYAGGKSGFDLQEIAFRMKDAEFRDYTVPGKGFVRGEALQAFINRELGQRPLERLNKVFGAVATDLGSGEPVLFRSGDTGMAVRASSSVPGVFVPVSIAGRDYVDGGLVHPVPVAFARSLGADLVIAVDISGKPRHAKTEGIVDVVLQAFTIMGHALARQELTRADVLIQPEILTLSATTFEDRHQAILEGEKAAARAMPELRAWIERWTAGGR